MPCKHKHIVALLIKPGELLGTIAVDIGRQAIAVGSNDNRNLRATTFRAHETEASALKEFYSALQTSRDRGWQIAYFGQRLHG